MFRLYIVPIIGTGVRGDGRRPKYFADGSLTDSPTWTGIDYGLENWMVVGADLSVTDDNFVVGQPDGLALPFDLSALLTSAQVANVKNKLEAINVPAGWVSTSLTWLQVVRTVLGMFSFMQRFVATKGATLFTTGVTLATTFGQLGTAVQANLISTAQSFGFDTSQLTASTTLRAILKFLADQFGTTQYNFNGTLI